MTFLSILLKNAKQNKNADKTGEGEGEGVRGTVTGHRNELIGDKY